MSFARALSEGFGEVREQSRNLSGMVQQRLEEDRKRRERTEAYAPLTGIASALATGREVSEQEIQSMMSAVNQLGDPEAIQTAMGVIKSLGESQQRKQQAELNTLNIEAMRIQLSDSRRKQEMVQEAQRRLPEAEAAYQQNPADFNNMRKLASAYAAVGRTSDSVLITNEYQSRVDLQNATAEEQRKFAQDKQRIVMQHTLNMVQAVAKYELDARGELSKAATKAFQETFNEEYERLQALDPSKHEDNLKNALTKAQMQFNSIVQTEIQDGTEVLRRVYSNPATTGPLAAAGVDVQSMWQQLGTPPAQPTPAPEPGEEGEGEGGVTGLTDARKKMIDGMSTEYLQHIVNQGPKTGFEAEFEYTQTRLAALQSGEQGGGDGEEEAEQDGLVYNDKLSRSQRMEEMRRLHDSISLLIGGKELGALNRRIGLVVGVAAANPTKVQNEWRRILSDPNTNAVTKDVLQEYLELFAHPPQAYRIKPQEEAMIQQLHNTGKYTADQIISALTRENPEDAQRSAAMRDYLESLTPQEEVVDPEPEGEAEQLERGRQAWQGDREEPLDWTTVEQIARGGAIPGRELPSSDGLVSPDIPDRPSSSIPRREEPYESVNVERQQQPRKLSDAFNEESRRTVRTPEDVARTSEELRRAEGDSIMARAERSWAGGRSEPYGWGGSDRVSSNTERTPAQRRSPQSPQEMITSVYREEREAIINAHSVLGDQEFDALRDRITDPQTNNVVMALIEREADRIFDNNLQDTQKGRAILSLLQMFRPRDQQQEWESTNRSYAR